MAYDPLALADMVSDGLDLSKAEVTDLVKAVPFLNILPLEKSSNGTSHKYPKETGAPVVGFRAVNAGRDEDSSTEEVVEVGLKVLDFSWSVDKAAADAWKKGGKAGLVAHEGLRHITAGMTAFEKQLFYGTSALGDAAGFTGMSQAATVDAKTDAMCFDAAGTTVGGAMSVWAVRIGPNDLMGVVNGDGAIELGDTVVQRITDGSGKTYPGYYTPGCTWLGLQVGSIHSMGRIVNLTAESGHTLTDDMISELLSLFPVGKEPTHLLMNRRARKQLKQSRTATNVTGATAPTPTESDGVPIVCVESLVNTEALVA